MTKEMLINTSQGEECRIAVLEDGRLEELYMERTSSTSHVGNIYKGRVTNVEASIQAAFVDFGLGRNGFLHITDLRPSYFGRAGAEATESVGRKLARRDRPPIQRCLRRGDEILVQIIKEGIGTKGPTLSTYISIPGRILVMMPGMAKFGVSRKIEDEDERRRLRQILDSLDPIDEVGFIIRTAGVGKTKAEIQRDLAYLTRVWQNVEQLSKRPAPVELYTEGDLVTRTVRDVYTPDIGRIVIDDREVADRVKAFFKMAMPRTKTKLELYDAPVPLFHRADIEREIEQMYSRHVPLPSGGSLVIDSTEAVVAIDVNSGKFREHADAETTAYKTDMEAADEIPRQLRLRDLGGVIICDFIDLRFERHRRDVEQRLHENLKNDRAKSRVLRMSQFGIIEMTRQRMRPSLKRSIYFDCPHCKGSGLVKTPESMSLDVARRLAIAAHDERVARVELAVSNEVAFYLLNHNRRQLADLEKRTGKPINVRADAALSLDGVRLELFDSREGAVWITELGMSPADSAAGADEHRGEGRRGRGGRGGRGRRGEHRDEGARHGTRRPAGLPTSRIDEHDEQAAAEREIESEAEGLDESGEEAGRPPREPDSPEYGEAVGEIVGEIMIEQGDVRDQSMDSAEPGDRQMIPIGEEEPGVIDVEDGVEPLGEAPRSLDEGDRWRDRGRDRGGDHRNRRDRHGRDQGRRGSGQQRDRDRGHGAGHGHGAAAGQIRPIDQRQPVAPVDGGSIEDEEDNVGNRIDEPVSHTGSRDRGRDGGRRGGFVPRGHQGQRGPHPMRGPQPSRGPQPPRPPQLPRAPVVPHEPAIAVAVPGPIGAGGEGDENGEGGQRRRRRRRGGRRHRRRRERAEAARLAAPTGELTPADDAGPGFPEPIEEPAQEVAQEPPVEEIVAAPAEPPQEEAPLEPKRRRSRAGTTTKSKSATKGRRPAPKRKPPAASARDSESSSASTGAVLAPLPRSGGADKHLADDVPIDLETPRRPRRYSDLDEIPGELD